MLDVISIIHGMLKECHYLWLLACDRSQLSEGGGEQGGEEEGGAQEVEDLQRQLPTHNVLQEPNSHFKQSGGEVDTHLHHILGA